MLPRMRLVLGLSLVAALVSACGTSSTGTDSGEPSVVTGAYPYAFVVEQVGGEDVTVTNLSANAAEPHDLELTAQQVGEVAQADLVVYARGFQPAVDDAVDQEADDHALDVLDVVRTRNDGEQVDPHIWLDPVRLASVAEAVAERLAEVHPEQAEAFESRADEFAASLEQLHDDFASGLGSCTRHELVTTHDAFGYLAERYGLEQVSLTGLSAEAEPSPRRFADVVQQARASGATVVFAPVPGNERVAQQLARELGAEVLPLHTLEAQPDEGDYVSAMRANLAHVRAGLLCE